MTAEEFLLGSELSYAQKQILRKVSVWKRISSPNGSNYKQQILPEGDHGEVSIRSMYNRGYICTWLDGSESMVPFTRVGLGEGVCFGAHFCTEDQGLKALY
jgi:hypothetical protein